MASISSLYDDVAKYGLMDADYYEKMIHPIPKTTVVDRVAYLVEMVKGKIVLDLGASGPIVKILQEVAKEYHGADKVENPDIENFYQVDFDRCFALKELLHDISDLQLIVAGEIIEHLSNAGLFLDNVYQFGVPTILTVPNAGGINQRQLVKIQVESVNRDHVAWYSYTTLRTLIERHKFKLVEWHWYNGQPYVAEGLIFKMEPIYGTD